MLLFNKLVNTKLTACRHTKRGVVFGMESRVLKKQFSELFLTRMQSVDSTETHEACRHTKRGAVFGMDARIALVIFSILGLTSAYFAKNIIASEQERVFVQQIKDLRTAVKQNLADNGYDFTGDGTNLNGNILGLKHMTSSVSLPEGRNNSPYVSMLNADSRIKLPWNVINVDMNRLYASVTIDPANDSNSTTTDCANTAKNCYYFVRILYADEKTFKLIEEIFDGETTGLDDTTARTTGIIVASATGSTIFMRVGRRL